MRRIKTLIGYAEHARFLAELDDEPLGYIPTEIHQPYRFGPTHAVSNWNGRRVVVAETRHRRYEVFEVPAETPLLTDEAATDLFIARKKETR